jgi:urease accessory protein UreF
MQTQVALRDAAEWLGDWHPLAEQLGSADGLIPLGQASRWLRLRPVQNLGTLRCFLREYQTRVLVSLELPAIQSAHDCLAFNGLRELMALDRQLADEPLLRDFAQASQRVGRFQLQKLRPLRDQRMVIRYLRAVEGGEAYGWHTLVYGVTLGIYSLPLRQGLLGYAQQTTRGFIYAAARALHLSEATCRQLYDAVCADLPAAVELLIRPGSAA